MQYVVSASSITDIYYKEKLTEHGFVLEKK
jgi:hypothetical protein